MPYHSHNSYGDGGGWAYLIALIIIAAIFTAYVTFRCCVIITRTLWRYGKSVRWLWISVALFAVLLIAGVLLGMYVDQTWSELGLAGFAQLVGCCKYVETKYNQFLLSEEGSLTQRVLGTSWWADYNT